jgi:hypothetical protein
MPPIGRPDILQEESANETKEDSTEIRNIRVAHSSSPKIKISQHYHGHSMVSNGQKKPMPGVNALRRIMKHQHHKPINNEARQMNRSRNTSLESEKMQAISQSHSPQSPPMSKIEADADTSTKEEAKPRSFEDTSPRIQLTKSKEMFHFNEIHTFY